MAEDGAGTAGEHRRHPPTAPGETVVANGVDAPVDRDQPPIGEPPIDRVVRYAEGDELTASDNPMLAGGNSRSLERTRGATYAPVQCLTVPTRSRRASSGRGYSASAPDTTRPLRPA